MEEQNLQPSRCSCEQTQLRFKLQSNNAVFYGLQCLRCGRCARRIAKAELPSRFEKPTPPWDNDLARAFSEEVQEKYKQEYDQQRREEAEEWGRRYNDHMQ